jgi:prephenate dehydratase
MAIKIYSTAYYSTTVQDVPGEACKLLERLAEQQVNLLAFHSLPLGPDETRLLIYPLNPVWLAEIARKDGLLLEGPHHAFIVHGDDELGALVDMHKILCDADINLTSSNGVADGKGGYRYILHVADIDFERAERLLGADTAPSHLANFNLKLPRHFSQINL